MLEVPFFCTMLSTWQKNGVVHYALAILSGILLWLAWPHNGFTPLIFIAWVPLLMAEDRIKSPFGFFFILWTSFLIWNIFTTWWIWNSTGPGAAGAIIANSLIMCFPVMAYRKIKKKLGLVTGLVGLIAFWLTYEYIHHNWDLSWPWLTLGNAFATKPEWIQWYRFTGTTGGSLWVLLINVLLFHGWKQRESKIFSGTIHLAFLVGLTTPVSLGWLFYPTETEVMSSAHVKANTNNVVVVQPNVEAYTEKFSTDPVILVQSLIDLSKSQIDSNTRLVVWPETAIPAQSWEHEINANPLFLMVFEFLNAYPKVQLVTGIDSYILWGDENPGGMSIRRMNNGQHYEAFNTALGKSSSTPVQLYHKSKLVPGVEALPSWLGFMSSVFDDFGGISGSLGRSKKAEVFSAPGNPYIPAPVICYESIYSDYVTKYVREGGNIITVITNDGWWGNTAGHHQHMHYARLRAIETGLWVARSANTGISCFIDAKGHIYQPQPWDTQAAIKMNIPAINEPTFYSKTGDWISILAIFLTILLFAYRYLAPRIWKKQ
jgi:apolipoprotein N-acyltransferase